MFRPKVMNYNLKTSEYFYCIVAPKREEEIGLDKVAASIYISTLTFLPFVYLINLKA